MKTILNGKSTETYACQDGDNPIATLIEAILLKPERKKYLLDTGDPRAAIEKIKKFISLRRIGMGENASWMYMFYSRAFDVHFRVMSSSRIAENMRYNPF